MGCNNKPWGQLKPVRQGNGVKQLLMGRKRGSLARNMAVFKFHGHGDDRHSKNGYATFFLALILLGAKKGVATAPKSSNI